MLLGQLLAQMGDEVFAAETLLGLGDLPLMVDVENAAERFHESTPAYAVEAVRRFEAFADDEDWVSLMGALGRSEDPGATCLRHILAWSLRTDRTDSVSPA
jgi:hypothetical protein